MRETTISKVVRILLGVLLLVFGLNGLFQFMPAPMFNEKGSAFLGALLGTGYMFPALTIMFLLVGLLLVANRFVALALVLLAPLSINILLFHIFLDWTGMLFALLVVVPNVYLGWAHFGAYKGLFK